MQRESGSGPKALLTSRPWARGAVAELAVTGWEAGNCLAWRLARILEFNYQAVEPGISLLKPVNQFSSGKLAVLGQC